MLDRARGIYGFCVGAAYGPGLLAAASMPRWWAIALGLPLLSTLSPRGLSSALWWCWGAAFVWAIASLAVVPVPASGAFDLGTMVLCAAVMCAAAEWDEIESVLTGLGWGVALSVPVAVGQTLGWSPVPHGGHAGFFLNAEVFGIACAPLAAWAVTSRRSLLAILLGGGLGVSMSRAGLLAFALGCVWALPAARGVKVAALLLLGGAGIAALLLLGEGKLASAQHRAVLWGAALYAIAPLGRGLGWWAAAHPFALEEYVHSDVLQAFVELGVGAVFLLAIPVGAWRSRGGTDAQRAAFVTLCCAACISFPMRLPATVFLFALLAGALVRPRGSVRLAQPDGRRDDRRDVRWSRA